MRYLIINSKNYLEASGKRLDSLLRASSEVSSRKGETVRVYIALPAFYLGYAAARFPSLNLLAQHLDDEAVGSTTGFLVPEIAKASGVSGSLINHSEHRLEEADVGKLVKRLRGLRMKSYVCARDEEEVRKFAAFSPDFVAIEPPELIGSGNAVSKARPEIIVDSRNVLDESRPAGSTTKLLCGAGIVDESDARIAVELGAEGVLVASGVVKSRNWKSKINALATGISDAKQKRLGQ
jgi:triosephosphate isomerase (TIM)